MPKITKSNVKEHLLNAVKNYVQLTGEQVGIILTNEGNISVIGKEAFKDFANEHRREIVRTMVRTSSSTEIDPFSQISHSEQTEASRTLDSESDLSTYTIERLRHLLTSAIRESTGESRIFSKKTIPKWWIPGLSFKNTKSGFTKDILVQLLTSFRTYNPEDSPEIVYRTTNNNTPSPHRERSPSIIRVSLESRVQKGAIQQDVSSSPTTTVVSPPTPFQNLSEAEHSSSRYPSPLLDSEPNSYQDAHYDSEVGLEVEIEDDMSNASSCIEPFFPHRRTTSEFGSILSDLPFIAENEKATALSELTGPRDTNLTDVTIHVFMLILRNQFPHIHGLQDVVEGQLEYRPYPYDSIQIHNDMTRDHWLVSCANKEGKVSVYDSFFDNTTDEIDLQLAQIYPQKDKFVYTGEKVQQQEGSTDCGLFATAVCTAIALGIDPSTIRWHQHSMRNHLAECIRKEHLYHFPEASSNRHRIRTHAQKKMSFKLFCICNLPQTKSRYMVKCIMCNLWYHNSCVGYSDYCVVTPRMAKLFRCDTCVI